MLNNLWATRVNDCKIVNSSTLNSIIKNIHQVHSRQEGGSIIKMQSMRDILQCKHPFYLKTTSFRLPFL